MHSTRPLITTVRVLSVPAPLGRPGRARERQLSIGLATDQSPMSWGNALNDAHTLSDQAIEEAVRRVLARMTGDMVRRIVHDTAERLIREEIEKIKAAAGE